MRDITTYDSGNLIYDRFTSIFNHLPEVEQRCVFLVDENVYIHYTSLFDSYNVIVVPSGEQQKSLSYAETVIEKMIGYDIDKGCYMIGVGGGVVCDLTGFIASIYLRGIKFALVPTSLLAMVDASIGGKNAVNSSLGKNLIGLICQPDLILCDIDFLSSLPKHEIVNGMAEIIKHACIASDPYFEYIEQHLESILALDPREMLQTIIKSAEIKTDIVSQDPLDKSERYMLNYGHTYGHAIEKALEIPHGHAVSIGIVMINTYALQRGWMLEETAQRIENLLHRSGLRTAINADEKNCLAKYLSVDKKRQGVDIKLAIVHQIGQGEVIKQPLTTLY